METIFRFTKQNIEQVPIPNKRLRVRDTGVPGLVLDMTPSGSRTFRVYKKLKGQASPVNVTLGKYPGVSIEQARKLALDTINSMSSGVNPNERQKAEKQSLITLTEVLEEYLGTKNLSESTQRDYKAAVSKYLADYAHKPLKHITEEVVKREHSRLTKNSPAQADLVMRVLRALFNYAKYEYRGIDNQYLFELNPVQILSHLRLWNKVGRRNTRLTQKQLPDWFKGLSDLRQTGDPYTVAVCDLAEMAILTGLRRSEMLSLTWPQVDLPARTYFLTRTKNGDPLELPISDHLLTLLERRFRYKDEKGFVFNAPNAHGVIREPKKILTAIRGKTGIDFTLHDLRRTFTTTAESLNVGPYMIKRLLNHRTRRDDVTAGYIVLTPEELRGPAQLIENKILEQAGIAIYSATEIDFKQLLSNLSEEQRAELAQLASKG